MNTPPIVSPEEWQTAWEQLLVKEKEFTRARDADSVAAFGGIVGLNRVIDPAVARVLIATFIEARAPAASSDGVNRFC